MISIKLTREQLNQTMDEVLKKIDGNIEVFRDVFPEPASMNQVYKSQKNDRGWTQSFWTGMVWLAYEVTGDKKYLELGKHHSQSFAERIHKKLGTDTHDLGFLYTLSAVADYKITGDEVAKQIALDAADELMSRYKEKGDFIQAWGSIHDPANYRLIIDCYMNLPLLFWASQVTGDDKYATTAAKHAHTARKVTIREDHSTYHTYFFNPETGAPLRGETAQGYGDDSCWSRGQAWAIYGQALCYKYTKDPVFMDEFYKVTDYFIEHLPEDQVAYWDLYFTQGEEERDSSAAVIAVCGILEMVKHIEDANVKKDYLSKANEIMVSLVKDYTTFDSQRANGLLFHGVYSKPDNGGVDEMMLWGDYFFMEAMTRLHGDWEIYW